jgi:hypothetical protein
LRSRSPVAPESIAAGIDRRDGAAWAHINLAPEIREKLLTMSGDDRPRAPVDSRARRTAVPSPGGPLGCNFIRRKTPSIN